MYLQTNPVKDHVQRKRQCVAPRSDNRIGHFKGIGGESSVVVWGAEGHQLTGIFAHLGVTFLRVARHWQPSRSMTP